MNLILRKNIVAWPVLAGLSLCLLCLPGESAAQDQPLPGSEIDLFSPEVELPFEHITVDDGLPENSVRAILQDSSGFLWFGTMNGLVRFDGYEMQVFAPSQTDTTSFGGRTVLALHEDDAGDIWIGTYLRGLWKYDALNGSFRAVDLGRSNGGRPESDRVNAITQDAEGALWVGMQYGLVSVDPATEIPTWHDEVTNELIQDNSIIAISSVLADTQGRIWCATATCCS